MAVHGRRSLRNLFDDAPTPHIAHPPRTHHRQFYLATDGSYRADGGGLGAVIETREGRRVARLSRSDAAPDNNVAEYRALHLGLDALATRAPGDARVGVLIDHDDLAANVNRAVLAAADPDWNAGHRVDIPAESANHWRGIRARIAEFGGLRAARIDSRENPAHPLANAPGEFAHVEGHAGRRVGVADADTTDPIPPPSRADRRAGD